MMKHCSALIFLSGIMIVFSTQKMWGRRSILPDQIKECDELVLASEFIEHYYDLLLQDGSETAADAIRLTKERGLKYVVGNDSRIRALTGDEEFCLSLADRFYSAQWSRGGTQLVELSFPSRIDLLTFCNKIELEDKMFSMLDNPYDGTISVKLPEANASTLKKVDYSPFYVRDLGYYITPRLCHQVVYKPVESREGKCEILMDSSSYPLECISNYMLTGYSPYPIDINLTFDRYGYQTSNLNVSLRDIHRILSSEGSIPYWGVDEYDGNIVKGVYVWLNRSGGFAHVLTVDIPSESLSAPSEAKASMHSYVRLDNLKTLFEEFQ